MGAIPTYDMPRRGVEDDATEVYVRGIEYELSDQLERLLGDPKAQSAVRSHESGKGANERSENGKGPAGGRSGLTRKRPGVVPSPGHRETLQPETHNPAGKAG